MNKTTIIYLIVSAILLISLGFIAYQIYNLQLNNSDKWGNSMISSNFWLLPNNKNISHIAKSETVGGYVEKYSFEDHLLHMELRTSDLSTINDIPVVVEIPEINFPSEFTDTTDVKTVISFDTFFSRLKDHPYVSVEFTSPDLYSDNITYKSVGFLKLP